MGYNDANPGYYNEEVAELTKTVKLLLDKFNKAQNNNLENDFIEDNLNHEIVIILEDGTERTGKLLGIDKFRINIELEGTSRFYFKHSVIGYYLA